MKVKECMCSDVLCATPNDTVYDCAKTMLDNHIGCIPVCDGANNVIGMVTDRDIVLRVIACGKDEKTTQVSEIMTSEVCTCTCDTEIDEAQELMSKNQVRRLPVLENNKIVGILTLGDLAKNESVNNTLENICKCDIKHTE